MAERRILIVGAGLAGLAAGCYARMNGYAVQIVERQSQPGGVVMHWRRKGYTIDGGIHFVLGHRPGQPLYDLYRELGILPAVHLQDPEIFCRFAGRADESALDITADLDRLETALRSISPADAGPIAEFVAGARAFRGRALTADMGTAPELQRRWDGAKQLWAMRRLLPYFLGRYGRSAADYARRLQSSRLRTIIENLFLPEVPVWFLFMLLACVADRQVGFVEGGSGAFVAALAERYRALGGEIAFHTTVEEVLVQDGRAVGVRLEDGTTLHADAVISAGDGHHALYDMLGGRYVDAATRARYETWPLIRPLLMVSFGAAHRLDGEPYMTAYELDDPITIGPRRVDRMLVRVFNLCPDYAPPGHTTLQAEMETEWDYWNDLQAQDRAAYDAAKESVAREVLARLEPRFPGLTDRVEMIDVATPYTTWRYTLNHRGAYEGWLPTPRALISSLPRTLPGLAGLYMAGQWVVPGGGIPACLLSGKQAVQLLCRDDDRPFVQTA